MVRSQLLKQSRGETGIKTRAQIAAEMKRIEDETAEKALDELSRKPTKPTKKEKERSAPPTRKGKRKIVADDDDENEKPMQQQQPPPQPPAPVAGNSIVPPVVPTPELFQKLLKEVKPALAAPEPTTFHGPSFTSKKTNITYSIPTLEEWLELGKPSVNDITKYWRAFGDYDDPHLMDVDRGFIQRTFEGYAKFVQ
jgi:hypothetical protein